MEGNDAPAQEHGGQQPSDERRRSNPPRCEHGIRRIRLERLLDRSRDIHLPLLTRPYVAWIRPVEDRPELEKTVLNGCPREAVTVSSRESVQSHRSAAEGVLDPVSLVDDDDGEVLSFE